VAERARVVAGRSTPTAVSISKGSLSVAENPAVPLINCAFIRVM
jgi:hypothetical protein